MYYIVEVTYFDGSEEIGLAKLGGKCTDTTHYDLGAEHNDWIIPDNMLREGQAKDVRILKEHHITDEDTTTVETISELVVI